MIVEQLDGFSKQFNPVRGWNIITNPNHTYSRETARSSSYSLIYLHMVKGSGEAPNRTNCDERLRML